MIIVRISPLISSHVFASVGSMGLGVAPPCAAIMYVALRHAMCLSVTPPCDALCCYAGCVSRCTVCCVVRCVPLSAPHACVLQCCVLLHLGLFVVLLWCGPPSVAPVRLVLLTPLVHPGGCYD